MQYVERLRTQPMAIETDAANTQHYEVGTGVLAACLGPRMKYSCCLYPTGKETLAEAEELMLQSYIEKAELKDGMSVLDLGYVFLIGVLHRSNNLHITNNYSQQMWLGIWCAFLCGEAPQLQDHGLFELAHSEAAHRLCCEGKRVEEPHGYYWQRC